MIMKSCIKSTSSSLLFLLFAVSSHATVISLNDKGEYVVEEIHDFRYDPPEVSAGELPAGTSLDDLVDTIETATSKTTKVIDENDHDAIISAEASKYENLSIDIVHAVIKAESNYNPMAVSHKGAEGLMQLMPSTSSRLGVQNAFLPSQNIRGGTYELSRLIAVYDDLPLALAAYNAGEAAVAKYGGIPPYDETQTYVTRVLEEVIRRQSQLLEAQNTP